MRHCPICNKSSDEIKFYGEFCADHASKKLEESLPHQSELETCKDCKRINVAGKFVEENSMSIERAMKRELKKYSVELVHFGNGIARVRVTDEKQDGLQIETNIHVKRVNLLCDTCARIRSGYFEAIVQIRGEHEKVGRMAEALRTYVEKNGSFVTKVETKEHGLDVYIGSKKAASAFLSSRRLKFKASYELNGMKQGRRLYRNTYFLTL